MKSGYFDDVPIKVGDKITIKSGHHTFYSYARDLNVITDVISNGVVAKLFDDCHGYFVAYHQIETLNDEPFTPSCWKK